MKRKAIILLFILTVFAVNMIAESVVRKAFLNGTPDSKPWTLWYWINGDISKEGIKADLQAMHDIGLAGAYLVPIRGKSNRSKYEHALEMFTPEWWDMISYTMEQAEKQGLKLGMHVCPGFALAGGPWITPEKSMQKVVWTETVVKGHQKLKIKLDQPETVKGYYKDIATFAYLTPSGVEIVNPKPIKIISSDTLKDLSFLADENIKGRLISRNPVWVQYEYESPFLCRSIVTKMNGRNYQCHRFKVEASDDGINYRFIAQLETPRHGWQNEDFNVTHSIPPTKARFFRFSWTKDGSLPGAEDLDNAKWSPTQLMTGLYLYSEPRIHQFEGKNASVWRVSPNTTEKQLPAGTCIPEDKLIDITSFLDSDGVLNWKAPKGKWTILRIGHTTNGMTNYTGGEGLGLECDKFNTEIVKFQFNNWFGKVYEVVGPEKVSKVLKIFYIDSWECGSQNWSEKFPQEFQKRRGYSLMPYLPVMAGIPVGSVQKSEQVLYDVRQTISELVNDVFYKTLADEAKAKGCLFTAESVAPTMTSDGMYHYKIVDLPMGEFWTNSPTHDKPNDMFDAISGGHIYGKNIIQAEAFTQLRTFWDETPDTLKTLLDRNFALGINRLVFHVYALNPFIDRKPGISLDGIGLFFQRDQTWWKPGKAWIDYIRRCQSLLQIGHPVSDIAVFSGLEIPRRSILPDRLVPSLPGIFGTERVAVEKIRLENKGVPMAEKPYGVYYTANTFLAEDWVDPLRGYSYDTFNPDVLFNIVRAENGRITLPNGKSYSMLVMPLPHPMAPDAMTSYTKQENRLREVLISLVKDKVNVLAPEYLAGDLKIKPQIPWKEDDFSALGLKRDFEVSENGKPAYGSVAWTHRADKGLDIYFISNQEDKYRRLDITLRADGRVPELYDAKTGCITEVLNWTANEGRTSMSLDLAPKASIFIIFEYPTDAKSCKTEQTESLRPESFKFQGPWTVKFDTLYGGPAKPVIFDNLCSWTSNADPGVKYYSGTAVYSNTLILDEVPDKNRQYRLNLGKVANLAEVYVNGENCDVAWTEPYSVSVGRCLKKGLNQIDIHITNTWANRIEGDAKIPEKERVTWSNNPYKRKTHDLLDAGLFGPIRLESVNFPMQKLSPKFDESSKNIK